MALQIAFTMATINDLPNEIASAICQFLDTRDELRAVRFLNHSFDGASQLLLYRTLYLSTTPMSFDRINEIGKSSRLHPMVQVIVYNGNQFVGDRTLLAEDNATNGTGFWWWQDRFAGSGLGMTHYAMQRFISQFSEAKLFAFYQSYLHHLKQQQRLMEGNNEMDWLARALQRFPRLLAVEYTEDSQYDVETDTVIPFSPLNKLARRVLALPRSGMGDHDSRFWDLVEVVCALDRPIQLERLFKWRIGPDVCPIYVEREARLTRYRELVSSLVQLTLTFRWDIDPRSHRAAHLVRLLEDFKSLKVLNLGFECLPNVNEGWPGLTLPLRFEFLHTLALTRIEFSSSSLKDFLTNHSSTLQSLKLKNISLSDDTDYWAESCVGWIYIMQFLEQTMSLRSMTFDGHFTFICDNYIEIWNAIPQQALSLRAYNTTCNPLLSRIERYITENEPCPFTRKPDSHAPKAGNVRPEDFWTWEDEYDHSWISVNPYPTPRAESPPEYLDLVDGSWEI